MATASNREVRLGVEITTANAGAIQKLAGDFRTLAKEGGEAAPEFARLADELDGLAKQAESLQVLGKLADDTARLGAEQTSTATEVSRLSDELQAQVSAADKQRAGLAEQRAAHAALNDTLKLTRNELQALRSGVRLDGESDEQSAARKVRLAAEVQNLKDQLVRQGAALRSLRDDVVAAEAVEASLQKRYDGRAAALTKVEKAQAEVAGKQREAAAAALALGVASDDLAASEAALVAQTLRLQQAGQAEAATIAELTAAFAKLSAEAKPGAVAALADALDEVQREGARAASALDTVGADATAATAALDKLDAEARATAAAFEAVAREAREVLTGAQAGQFAALTAALDAVEAEATAVTSAFAKLSAEAKSGAARRQADEYGALSRALDLVGQEAVTASAALDRVDADSSATSAALDKLDADARSAAAAFDALGREAKEALSANQAGQAAALASALDTVEAEAQRVALAMGRAQQSTKSLSDAFGSVRLRGLDAIEGEVVQVERAMARLSREFRAGGISAADFDRATAGATVRLAQLRQEAATIPALPSAFERLNSSITAAVGKFGALTAAIATVGVAVRPVIEAEVALQSVTRVLTQVGGGSGAAAAQIKFLREEAQRSGVSFTDTAQAYAKFAASAQQAGQSTETVQRAFAAVANATGNLGLNSEQAKRALEALSQIASKGTVSMEELRQQLGDALPGVVPLLAKELGVTTRELGKMVETGQLLASDTLPFIIAAIEKLGTGQTAKVEGLRAEWERLKNTLLDAGTAIVDGPLGQAAGAVLAGLSTALAGLSTAAVTVSNGLRLVGETAVAAGAFAAGGFKDLDTFLGFVGESADKAKTRIQEFGDRASGATSAVLRLSQELQRQTGLNEEQARSFAKIIVAQKDAADAADAATKIAERGVEARKAEAAAIERSAALSLDEAEKRRAAAEAAHLLVAAVEAEAAAKQNEVNVARAALAEREKSLTAVQRESDEVQKLLAKQREAIDVKVKDAEAARAQAVAARAAADAARVAAETYGDQSARVTEFAQAVRSAEAKLAVLKATFKDNAGAADLLRIAEDELREAKVKLRDATDDLAKAIERGINALRAEAEHNKALIDLEVTKLKLKRDSLAAAGQDESARQVGIQIAQREREVQNLLNASKSQEAELRIAGVKALIEENRVRGTLTPELELELNTRLREAETLKLQADAQRLVNEAKAKEQTAIERGLAPKAADSAAVRDSTRARRDATAATEDYIDAIDAETGALVRRNREAANFTAKSNPVRGAGGQANKLTADGGENLSVLTPNSAPSVDNSYAFQVRDRLNRGGTFTAADITALQAGLAAAKNNATLAGQSSIPSLTGQRDAQGWVEIFRRALEQAGAGLGSGFPAPTPAPAPGPSGRTEAPAKVVRVELALAGKTFGVNADDDTAEELIAALEAARRGYGG